jgi:Domain of unknown function (DUF4189)
MEYDAAIGYRFVHCFPASMPGAGALPQPPPAVPVDLSH